jgi:hypothetical protein
MTARARLRLLMLAGFVSLGASCSVIFSSDDLSNGSTGSSSTSSSGSSSGGDTGCTETKQCDDGNPCTIDSCDPKTKRCAHSADRGKACGPHTDCTPQGKCNAEGSCAPSDPIDALCNDGNDCTDDRCEADGCHHIPIADAGCFNGDDCTMSACDNGKCVGATIAPTSQCSGGADCPAGTYRSGYFCNHLDCGGDNACTMTCVNAFYCSHACGTSFVACCILGDPTNCDDACGGMDSLYEPAEMVHDAGGCACSFTDQPGVRCVLKN